jgi:hypothetical protein
MWLVLFLLSTLAGCGTARNPILGTGGIAVPALTVTAVAPRDGATGAPINTAIITAAFSEPIAPIGGDSTFTVTCASPCTDPTGTVSLDATGRIATFSLTPATSLASLTLYTATISAVRSLATGLALETPYTWHFTTGVASDTSRPAVTLTEPGTTVPGPTVGSKTNTAIVAVFSEDLAPATVTSMNFTVSCAAPCVAPAGSVSYSVGSRTAVFTPTALLAAATTYTATITSAVTDMAGNALGGNQGSLPAASNYVWAFTTGANPDTTAPAVSSTNPLELSSGIAINSLISASFSELMDPLTITTANFLLACPASAPVAGTVGYAVNGSVATFTPSSNLPASTSCTATITTAVQDVAHNAIASAYTWTFTTGVAPDTTPPAVSSTSPLASAAGVAINTLVTASFSEPMDPLSITTADFSLACPAGTPIAGIVGYAVNGNVATFTPSSNLPASTSCTATITTAVQDVAHNATASAYTWTFTTGAAPDTTPPTVSSTSPLANAAGVAINTLVTASFSEPMDPLSITTADFSLACPAGTPIAGIVGYAVNGNVATFTPSSNLPASTACTATISTGVQDVAHNAMFSTYTWTFTTGVAPDTTPPTVSSTSPLASASGVAINTLVTASFSEPMDPLTITTGSFTLACPVGTAVIGTVGYAVNGNVATFTPASVLPASTNCTATITTAVQDVAHNAMASAYIWSFTTGAAPDTTPPTVSSTNPANGAVGVCINKAVNITFSEPIDPLTISTANFTLAVTAGAPVMGVVSYDAPTNIATFRTSADLTGTPATQYTATVKGGANGVKDLAGNSLAADQITTFTTNSSTCTTAPALGGASGFAAFGGIATLTNDGLATEINGDIAVVGVSTSITGLHDSGGNVYTTTLNNNGAVNGLIYTLTAPPGSVPGQVVTQALVDALAAFNSISPGNLQGGIDMSDLARCASCGGVGGGADELAGRILPPGVYLSATGTYDIGGAGRTQGSLTLDAGGDANAVWVFQTAAGTGTLTVGLTGPATPALPIKVLLINGAQPKNVFWYVPAGATIGTGSTIVGTMLANASITMSTTGGSPPTAVPTTVNGRAIALTAAVTMTNTVINVPEP